MPSVEHCEHTPKGYGMAGFVSSLVNLSLNRIEEY